MLIYTDEQAANLLNRPGGPAALVPVRLTDGTYALPSDVATDPAFAALAEAIAQGQAEPDTALSYATDDHFYMTIGGEVLRLANATQPYALTVPAPGLYRFEVHANDWGDPVNDPAHATRRCELVSNLTTYSAGQTLWESWSTVIGAQHAGFERPNNLGIIHQWHSVDTDTVRSPVLVVAVVDSQLVIATRSDATGSTPQTVYTAPAPAPGTVMNFVVCGLLGAAGQLKVWLNGAQIVDVATPIGYYHDDDGARALAYPHWGAYMTNLHTVDVVFHANLEWGTSDLSARIAAPVGVIEPDAGWT